MGSIKPWSAKKNTTLLYRNYKIFFSQVLLAVWDAKYKFIFTDDGQYGSANDSRSQKLRAWETLRIILSEYRFKRYS